MEQFGEINENGTRGEPSLFTNQSLLDEPRRPDINSTFQDIEGKTDREINNYDAEGESDEPVTSEHAVQDTTEQVEKPEVSGSGDESSAETKDDNDEGHEDTEGEEQPSHGGSRTKETNNVPILDKDETGSGQNIWKSGIENAEGRDGERESLFNKTEKQDTFDESKNGKGTTNQEEAVNVVGNQITGNHNEAPLEQNRTEESHSQEVIDAASSEGNLINQSAINEPESSLPAESIDQSAAVKDVNAYSSGDFDTPATQTAFSEPERVILEKGVRTQNEQPTIHDVQQDKLNQSDHPVMQDSDEASGGGNLPQEATEESALKHDQSPQIDTANLSEGPASSNDASSMGLDTEGTQLPDLHGMTSQEISPEDGPDEIPVYTLSMPSSEDSFPTEESTSSPIFTAPTSAVTTSSASYSEPPVEGESTFTAFDPPSRDDQFQSPTERSK